MGNELPILTFQSISCYMHALEVVGTYKCAHQNGQIISGHKISLEAVGHANAHQNGQIIFFSCMHWKLLGIRCAHQDGQIISCYMHALEGVGSQWETISCNMCALEVVGHLYVPKGQV